MDEDASCLLQQIIKQCDINVKQYYNKNRECDDATLEIIAVGLNAGDKNDGEDEPEIQRETMQDASESDFSAVLCKT